MGSRGTPLTIVFGMHLPEIKYLGFSKSIIMVRCIVIDDEQFSVDALSKYIALITRLEIAGIYLDAREALEQISRGPAVDVIFMDVDMPDISGMELAALLRHKARKLIFTTAHSKYAYGAFEADADAFLLKPFSFSRFAQTIDRFFPQEQATTYPLTGPDYFLVKNKEEDLRIVNVSYSEVIAFESMQNYVKIHLLNGKSIVAYLTLQDVLTLISSRPEFVQFHRAFVISASHIHYIEGQRVFMQGSIQFSVGDTYRETFNKFVAERLLRTARTKRPGSPSMPGA